MQQLDAFCVEPGERLVEQQQVRVVQKGPAEREALEHPAGERSDPLVARPPEPEALEHRASSLAALLNSVEPPVEVEVLERGQLTVDERLVAEKADRAARHIDLEFTVRRRVEPGAEPQQSRLPGAVRTCHDHEAAARYLEVERLEHALVAEALRQFPGTNHAWSLDFGRLRTQAWPIMFLLAAVLLAAGCGSKEQSDALEPAGGGSGEIVFVVNRNGWNEIWMMDADGENRRRLTDPRPSGSDAAGNRSPASSPDGKRIVFVGSGASKVQDETTDELYVMNADGSDVRQLTKNDTLDADPTWSPDGRRIAFVRADDWGRDRVRMSLRVLGSDGSGEHVLREENGPFFLSSPAWAPDGTRIAFTRSTFTETGVIPVLYVAGSDGSRPEVIARWAAQPAWSPDGKRLAFTSGADRFGQTCFHDCTPSGEIYVADPDGTNAKRLTESKADDQSPAWSSDGSEIVFASDRSNPDDHELELYVLPANGGQPRRITRNDVWDLDPDWRVTAVGYSWSAPNETLDRPEFEAWRGFRTRSGGVHCFMTGQQGWTGFVCFRATDGLYVQMVGRDLSTNDPVRVSTGTNPALRGYENAEVNEIEPGDHWTSSDAEMVVCSVRRAAVECRHASGHGFFLGQTRHKTF